MHVERTVYIRVGSSERGHDPYVWRTVDRDKLAVIPNGVRVNIGVSFERVPNSLTYTISTLLFSYLSICAQKKLSGLLRVVTRPSLAGLLLSIANAGMRRSPE